MAQDRLKVYWRMALIPLSLVIMAVAFLVFAVPLWALALFSLWVPLYFMGYPYYLRRKWYAFERYFAQKFQEGDYKALLERYESEWFLRNFAPRSEMLGKLALIYSGMEKYREAEQVLELAIECTEDGYRDRIYFNLANIKYELGKYDEADQMYKALRRQSPYRNAARAQLALIDLHKGREVEKARALLEREKASATGPLRLRIEEALSA